VAVIWDSANKIVCEAQKLFTLLQLIILIKYDVSKPDNSNPNLYRAASTVQARVAQSL
jgi:hypothetical protein